MRPSSASRRPAPGRLPGSLARQPPISDRSSPGSSPSWAGLLTSRYISRAPDPEPNGPCPVAAYTSTAPRLKMSLAGPTSWPWACSGERNPDEAKSAPGSVPGAAREIAKSVTRGPPLASMTFDGLRFPCTRPAACRVRRPSASPVASVRTAWADSGPRSLTTSASDGPATYGAASQGAGASRSASTTEANAPLTFRAAAISDRNQGSSTISARTAVSASCSPVRAQPRNGPSGPSCPSSRYGPIAYGASVVSGATTRPPLHAAVRAIAAIVSGYAILWRASAAVHEHAVPNQPTGTAATAAPVATPAIVLASAPRPDPAQPVTISERSASTVVSFRSYS